VPTEEQLQEIHRLAVLGDVADIAQDVGPRLTAPWLATSRFREVRELSLQTLGDFSKRSSLFRMSTPG